MLDHADVTGLAGGWRLRGGRSTLRPSKRKSLGLSKSYSHPALTGAASSDFLVFVFLFCVCVFFNSFTET